MTACTEFSFSRRIQRTAAYKVHGAVGQQIASGGCGRFQTFQDVEGAAVLLAELVCTVPAFAPLLLASHDLRLVGFHDHLHRVGNCCIDDVH